VESTLSVREKRQATRLSIDTLMDRLEQFSETYVKAIDSLLVYPLPVAINKRTGIIRHTLAGPIVNQEDSPVDGRILFPYLCDAYHALLPTEFLALLGFADCKDGESGFLISLDTWRTIHFSFARITVTRRETILLEFMKPSRHRFTPIAALLSSARRARY